ncbi:MAG: hypothetical protein H7Y20_10515, partial [Bryobacteraceae bacterium]|nr:hypothetical protein [Bryobacteraceae bacterium]
MTASAQPVLDRSPLAKLTPESRAAVGKALDEKDYSRAEQVLVDELARMPDAGLYGLLGSLFFVNGEYLNAGIALKKADV